MKHYQDWITTFLDFEAWFNEKCGWFFTNGNKVQYISENTIV